MAPTVTSLVSKSATAESWAAGWDGGCESVTAMGCVAFGEDDGAQAVTSAMATKHPL